MQISSRFTIGLHILTAIDMFQKDYKVTSDFLAGSIRTNPVVVRKILGQLKKAGLIHSSQGVAGITMAKPLEEIQSAMEEKMRGYTLADLHNGLEELLQKEEG